MFRADAVPELHEVLSSAVRLASKQGLLTEDIKRAAFGTYGPRVYLQHKLGASLRGTGRFGTADVEQTEEGAPQAEEKDAQ